MIDYSFIIPHKNTPDLLRKCIDSIPHRKDVQIIVVDDNSDADRVDFAHFPGLDEPCTEVYLTKKGKGAGFARNVGLQHAKGKWIVFADADDFFNPCIVEAMDKYKDDENDIVFFKCTSEQAYTGLPGTRFLTHDSEIDKAIVTGDFSILLQNTTPVMKFFKHQVILDNKIYFQEVRWGNDVWFYSKFVACSSKYVASSLAIYCVTNGASALSIHDDFEVQKARLNVELDGVRLLIPVMDTTFSIFWLYVRWFKVLRLNKFYGIIFLPKLIFKTNGKILKPICKFFLKDVYNSSKLKNIVRTIKGKK